MVAVIFPHKISRGDPALVREFLLPENNSWIVAFHNSGIYALYISGKKGCVFFFRGSTSIERSIVGKINLSEQLNSLILRRCPLFLRGDLGSQARTRKKKIGKYGCWPGLPRKIGKHSRKSGKIAQILGFKAFSPKKGLVFAVNGASPPPPPRTPDPSPPPPRPAPPPPFFWGAGEGLLVYGEFGGGGARGGRGPIYRENEPLFRRKRLF